jgi:hypothetical protein
MKMEPDNLEERLQSLPIRTVPGAWRQEILGAARETAGPRQPVSEVRPAPWWRIWLWPCPGAWAGVAAVWCVILALNLGVGRSERSVVDRSAPPPVPAQVRVAFDEQRRLLADLDLPTCSTLRLPPAVIPRPRSCRRPEQFVA